MMGTKKDILFIMNDLHSGGAQKALISLLQGIDFTRYNIDLLLFKKEGVFLEQLPASVNILPAPQGYSYFDRPLFSALLDGLKKGKFTTLINRLLAIRVLKSEKNPAVREQKIWKYLSPCLPEISKKYDAAIGFLEKTPNYFCIDKITADKKILWIHTNYSNMGMQVKYDQPYFQKANHIVTISEACAADLRKNFPQFPEKIAVIRNILSPRIITKLAQAAVPENLDFTNAVLTVGRLSQEKGIDMAVEAAKILMEKGIDFKWYFIGNGPLRSQLEAIVSSYQLQEHVFFLGEKANPYAYVKRAAVYAQTSRFEGQSIAVDEAKILQKPILTTNFSTASTQLSHLENGYIAAMNPTAIAEGISILLGDLALQEKFRQQLSLENPGTETEMEHFYQLIQ